MTAMTTTGRHRATADTFTRVAEGVADWDAPTPVKEWTARDVVTHLISWLSGLLSQADVVLPTGPSPAVDPVGAWRHHTRAVHEVLTDPDVAARMIPLPGGAKSVTAVIADYYEPDVFMHAWDLARASGQDFHLDAARCEELVTGMASVSDLIRGSGQFGDQVAVPDDAPAEDRLIGFIGRDPRWRSGR